jgi:hypothetical protein
MANGLDDQWDGEMAKREGAGCADGLVCLEPPRGLSKRARSVHWVHGMKVPPLV